MLTNLTRFLIQMKRVNWHVLLVGIGGLFVAGGPLVFVLTSFNISPAEQATILQRGAGIVGLLLALGAIVRMGLSQTDQGKADTLASLPQERQQSIVSKMPAEAQAKLAESVQTVAADAHPRDPRGTDGGGGQ